CRETASGAAEAANRATLELEPLARGAGREASRGNRADQPFAAISTSASGADDCFLGCAGLASGKPPPGGDGDVLRAARVRQLHGGVGARRGHGGPAGIVGKDGTAHLPI